MHWDEGGAGNPRQCFSFGMTERSELAQATIVVPSRCLGLVPRTAQAIKLLVPPSNAVVGEPGRFQRLIQASLQNRLAVRGLLLGRQKLLAQSFMPLGRYNSDIIFSALRFPKLRRRQIF